MPPLPSALPPKGEASHYGANNFLNLTALPERGRLRYDTRMLLPPHCHFERTREIFFVRGQEKAVREAGNGKHRASCDWGVRCFMQTALRRKTETGNEKDPSAALGMTKRERYISHSFSIPLRKPTSAPFCGRGMPKGQGVAFLFCGEAAFS